MKSKNLVLFTIMFSIILFPGLTLGADKFILNPMISASWQVDTNYYRSEHNEREVYTYLVRPGFEFGYETGKSSILLNYTLDAHYYDDKDSISLGEKKISDDNFFGHTANLLVQSQPFDRLAFRLDDSFIKTRDPGQSDRLSNSVTRDKYFINRVTPQIIYEIDRIFSAGIRYRNTELNYSTNDMEDSTEHRGILDLIYNFTQKASLDLQYQYWDKTYDKGSSDYASN